MDVLVLLTGATLLAISVYALLQKGFLRVVIGFILLGNAVNVLIFGLGRLRRGVAPILPHHGEISPNWANPLPQALILTAIVISFAVTAFALSLAFRVRRDLVELETDLFVDAEPAPADTDGSRATRAADGADRREEDGVLPA